MKQTPNYSQHGFTLIEIIGVLAIMSIMAATIAPSAIQMITAGKQTSEDKALAAISDSLRLFVQTTKQVPAAAAALPISGGINVVAWDKAIGTIMNVPASKVSTNTINKNRIYLYPADFIAASTPVPPLPYDQTAEATNLGGSGKLVTTEPDPRVMVISNMNPNVTLATASGSKAIDLFNAIWNQATVNGTTLPAELTESDKLKIARINMTDMFIASKFSNSLSADPYQSAIQIDGLPTGSYTWARSANTRSSITAYLIAGSAVALQYQEIATSLITTYDSNIMQPTSQKNFYFSGANAPAAWSVTQAGADAVAANSNNNNNNNNSGSGNSTSFTANANGVVSTYAQTGCTSSANPTLTVLASDQNNGIINDYYLYYGDSSGNIIAPIQTGNTQNTCKDFKNGKYSNKINTNDTDCQFTIPECSMVVIVPKAKPNNNAQTTLTGNAALSIFYMPGTVKTVTLP
ncbi:MAG: type II secretion system protein [Mariprofundales bacterium]